MMMTGPFQLHKVSNGGWIVEQAGAPESRYRSTTVAAFTDTSDLLTWLSQELPEVITPKVCFAEPVDRP